MKNAEKVLNLLEELIGLEYNEEEVLSKFEGYEEIETLDDLSIDVYGNGVIDIYSRLDIYSTKFSLEIEDGVIDGAYAE